MTEPMTEPMRIIGLAGWSGSGKTTLVTKALPRLIARGCRVSTIKHAHHGFDLDQPGKDSFMHRTAGATEVVISSAKRFAILHELRDDPEWDLPDLLGKLAPGRSRAGRRLQARSRFRSSKFIAWPTASRCCSRTIRTSSPSPAIRRCRGPKVPVIDLNDIEGIVDILLKHAVPLQSAAAAMRSA